VTNVTWHQARAYCIWLSEITGKHHDLPTEAQWEKAARGVDGRIFPWGNSWDRHLCNTIESLKRRPSEVGLYSPSGDSPFGCSDMAGNVWEWVLDWFNKSYYAQSNVEKDPLGSAHGMVKIIRGGSYRADAMQARCANRSYANPNNASPEVGFRVVMKSEP
jgi:formylglycine-generating enzyme required for sulfatase activity